MSSTSCARVCCLLSCLLASTFNTTVMAEGILRLNFGVYSSNKPSELVKVYRPILQELESNMSQRLNRRVDIRMKIARNYDQGIAHLVNGRVDFSAFGPSSYVEAKKMNKNIDILAVENVNNSKVFYGIIAVGKDSNINDIQELRGKSFAFGDEGSTIGRFLSQLSLMQAGIRAGDLDHYEYLGRHDMVGTAVGAGSFDAGALNEKTFKTLLDAGEPIRELTRFPNVTKPWLARAGLDVKISQALRGSLLDVHNQKTLAALKIKGFLEGTDNDYKVIREAMDSNSVFFTKQEQRPEQYYAKTHIEPNIQAAVAGSTTSIDESHAITIERTSASMDRDQHQLTVNITLPLGLLKEARQGHLLTINLRIPEDITDGAAPLAAGR